MVRLGAQERAPPAPVWLPPSGLAPVPVPDPAGARTQGAWWAVQLLVAAAPRGAGAFASAAARLQWRRRWCQRSRCSGRSSRRGPRWGPWGWTRLQGQQAGRYERSPAGAAMSAAPAAQLPAGRKAAGTCGQPLGLMQVGNGLLVLCSGLRAGLGGGHSPGLALLLQLAAHGLAGWQHDGGVEGAASNVGPRL